MTDIKGAFSPPVINPVPGQPIPKGAGNQTNTYFKPIFSIGADYTISQNWVADLAWTHLSVGQGISSVDFYSIGVAYHFTSKFCGQFCAMIK